MLSVPLVPPEWRMLSCKAAVSGNSRRGCPAQGSQGPPAPVTHLFIRTLSPTVPETWLELVLWHVWATPGIPSSSSRRQGWRKLCSERRRYSVLTFQGDPAYPGRMCGWKSHVGLSWAIKAHLHNHSGNRWGTCKITQGLSLWSNLLFLPEKNANIKSWDSLEVTGTSNFP